MTAPRFTGLLVAACLSTAMPGALGAQAGQVDRQIRENQARLDSIRAERERLEGERTRLRGQARDISSELENLSRQRQATTRIVGEMDRQIHGLGTQLDTITLDLLLAQDALAEKRAVRERRIVEVYKRGPLWAFQVLIASESFGDLLGRYKYLHMAARQDRALVEQVESLRDRIASERRNLSLVQTELARTRDDRGRELRRFEQLERSRQTTLRQTQQVVDQAQRRLVQLERQEQELTGLLADLERRRREAIAAGGVALAPALTPATRGRLLWPVEGPVVYRFGVVTRPGGTRIRYDGVGIGVPVGTPVRSIADGQVAWVGSYSAYGPTVMVDHGGGYWGVYLYLSRIDITAGQLISAGTVIGLSGGGATEEGPHIELQIRETTPNGDMLPGDPLQWLRPRS